MAHSHWEWIRDRKTYGPVYDRKGGWNGAVELLLTNRFGADFLSCFCEPRDG